MKNTVYGMVAGLLLLTNTTTAYAESATLGPGQATEQVKVLFQKTLESEPEKDMVLLTVEYPPGAGDSPHMHPGYTFVYVMAGEMVSQLEGHSKRVYRTGESWLEQPYEHHIICRNGSTSERAQILVFFLLKQGSKWTIDLPPAHHK